MATTKASGTRKQQRSRLTGVTREIMKHKIAAEYLEGKTLDTIRAAYGLSYGVARNLVIEAGVTMRGPGVTRPQEA